MKRYVKHACWIGAVVYAVALVAVLAQEPIEELRLPLEYLPDGTLRTELFARRATVQPDMSIVASGIVFRVFATNGTVETTITAEDAEFSRERLTGKSEKAVSMQQGDLLVTGEGFRWNGANGTLLIRRRARIAFPSEIIRKERISTHDKQKQ